MFALLRDAAPALLHGAAWTLFFATASMVVGVLLAFPLAVARILPFVYLQWPVNIYVSMMRGTPLLVQIFIIYYGLPSIGIHFSPIVGGILALSLNASAYLSESLRGAIMAIHRGQWEASYSLGLSYCQTLRHIVFPQAIRIAVPSLSNTLISLIKDTSLVSVITVTELMLSTKALIAATFQPLPLYLAAAALYWILSLCFEILQKKIERAMRQAGS